MIEDPLAASAAPCYAALPQSGYLVVLFRSTLAPWVTSMTLKLVSIESDGVVRISASEQMTATVLDSTGEQMMASAVGEDWASRKVCLNLEQTVYIDSSALGWLVASQKQFERNGGRLILNSISPAVQEVFDVMRFSSIMSVVDDEASALKLLRKRTKS